MHLLLATASVSGINFYNARTPLNLRGQLTKIKLIPVRHSNLSATLLQ